MGDAFDDLLESLDNLQPKHEHHEEEHHHHHHEEPEASYEIPPVSYDSGSYETPVAEPILIDYGDQQETASYSAVAPPPPPAPVYSPPKAQPYKAPSQPAPSYSAPSHQHGGNRCGKCGSDVGGEHIKAMEQVWHVHHFTCGRCNKELRGGAFFVHDGQPHCTHCVESMNPCSKCGRGITGQYMYSPHGEKWHMECVDRRTCGKCHGHIGETEISALGQHWHPHCFVCQKCHAQLSGNFVVKDGQPLCQNCSNSSKPNCHKCGQSITGEYVTFKGESLHNHCHTCAHCRRPLGVSGFYEVHGQPRCADCLSK